MDTGGREWTPDVFLAESTGFCERRIEAGVKSDLRSLFLSFFFGVVCLFFGWVAWHVES